MGHGSFPGISLHDRMNMADPSDITARQVNTEAAAMSNANGDVVAFDAASVYKGMFTCATLLPGIFFSPASYLYQLSNIP